MSKRHHLERIVEEVKLYRPALGVSINEYDEIVVDGESQHFLWAWGQQRTTGVTYMSFYGFGNKEYSGTQSYPVRKDGTMAYDKIAQRFLAALEHYAAVKHKTDTRAANYDDAKTLSKEFADTLGTVYPSEQQVGYFKLSNIKKQVTYAQAIAIADILKGN